MTEREATRYTEADWPIDRWPNFKFSEMACRETGACVMDPVFMDKVQRLRRMVGSLSVSSGYRSPQHSIEQAKVDRGKMPGSHARGRAIDLSECFEMAFVIVARAEEAGFTGIGIKQHGLVDDRFIHLDDMEGNESPVMGFRPTIWSYA